MSALDAIEGYLVLGLVLLLIASVIYHAIKDTRIAKPTPTQLNLSGLDARTNIRVLRSLLLLGLLAQTGQTLAAETIPYQEPPLTEATLLPLSSSAVSHTRFRNESLACDQAHTRAMNKLRDQIARARTDGQIEPHVLISFDSLRSTKQWSPTHGRCAVSLSLLVSDATWKPVRRLGH